MVAVRFSRAALFSLNSLSETAFPNQISHAYTRLRLNGLRHQVVDIPCYQIGGRISLDRQGFKMGLAAFGFGVFLVAQIFFEQARFCLHYKIKSLDRKSV